MRRKAANVARPVRIGTSTDGHDDAGIDPSFLRNVRGRRSQSVKATFHTHDTGPDPDRTGHTQGAESWSCGTV